MLEIINFLKNYLKYNSENYNYKFCFPILVLFLATRRAIAIIYEISSHKLAIYIRRDVSMVIKIIVYAQTIAHSTPIQAWRINNFATEPRCWINRCRYPSEGTSYKSKTNVLHVIPRRFNVLRTLKINSFICRFQ